ncbi:MAG: hypothetical protein AAFX93_04420 [Verrucomicrobiota bacterium]
MNNPDRYSKIGIKPHGCDWMNLPLIVVNGVFTASGPPNDVRIA